MMSKIEDAVNWAVDIANDDTHGYDQSHRRSYGRSDWQRNFRPVILQ